MCGIICICLNSESNQKNLENIFGIFKESINKRGPDWFGTNTYYSKNYHLLFAASVLWLQGKYMAKQPLQDDRYVIIYNGDIFGGLSSELTLEEGDTKVLFRLMHNTSNIATTLAQLQGPYSFIYFDKIEEKLYFGRDIYGRRSLLVGKHNEAIILTSVAKRAREYDFIELPSIGTFSLDMKTNQLLIFPWKHCNPNFDSKLTELKEFLKKDIVIVEHELGNSDYIKFVEPSSEQLHFYKNITSSESRNIFEKLINIPDWLNRILVLKNLLENSVEKRIANQPKYCKNCISEKKTCRHSSTGVLFSGGIDCAILALLADKFVDKSRPIDLINVAFNESNNYQTPDRLTSIKTLEELRQLRPEREWHFLEVNVPKEELNDARDKYIADLVYPLTSILDDSLGCALWFASRGKQETVMSTCRVLVVGMGADELFGGYTRHRGALKKKGWLGLHNVLLEDWQNLPYRNLGRDDRVVSDHGRQLRTPYLDENFVQYVRSLNSWEKTFPSEDIPQGIGEKILLRSLGYYLGLKNASAFKKRALQFGSRIANRKEKAHYVSKRLCS
ncbi:asparagine synthetase domain-containing protein CG17486 [Anoplophora glabripennis]|uniref:asparagine synthetase domain-containing protein CG17486 n=1 Tax=Anoplophora glabripennis TaxID=217634 RepID=UPI0008749C2F|nr:asparagine synthetase domain-containing protein CG17486 [Anoplophora glabripennis]